MVLAAVEFESFVMKLMKKRFRSTHLKFKYLHHKDYF